MISLACLTFSCSLKILKGGPGAFQWYFQGGGCALNTIPLLSISDSSFDWWQAYVVYKLELWDWLDKMGPCLTFQPDVYILFFVVRGLSNNRVICCKILFLSCVLELFLSSGFPCRIAQFQNYFKSTRCQPDIHVLFQTVQMIWRPVISSFPPALRCVQTLATLYWPAQSMFMFVFDVFW